MNENLKLNRLFLSNADSFIFEGNIFMVYVPDCCFFFPTSLFGVGIFF